MKEYIPEKYSIYSKYNEKEIEELFNSILKLKETIILKDKCYNTNRNLITKMHVTTINNFLKYIDELKQLIDVYMPTYEMISQYIQKEKSEKLKHIKKTKGYFGEVNSKGQKHGLGHYYLSDDDPELFGTFENNKFTKGISMQQKTKLFIGEYFSNSEQKEFTGILYPDLTEPIVCIGNIVKEMFYGMKIKSLKSKDIFKKPSYLISIETNKFLISINSLEPDLISFYLTKTLDERNIRYTYKIGTYLIASSFLGDQCFFSLDEETNNIISYKAPYQCEYLNEETILTVSFPSNNIYIGRLDPENDNKLVNEGEYIIREEQKSEFLFRFKGTWEAGHLIYGKVYNSKNMLIYEGMFINNMPSIGKYTFEEGEFFDGVFKNFNMHGKGKYQYSNGDCFVGNFINNNPRGEGIFINSKGNQRKVELCDNILIPIEN